MTARIVRSVGAAGTGKTSEMLAAIEKTVNSGIDNWLDIGFVSFTRAARQEAAERAAPLLGVAENILQRNGYFRTLHSICYGALGCCNGDVLADDKESRQWIGEAVGYPVEAVDVDDCQIKGDGPADIALQVWSVARNRLESFTAAAAYSGYRWERNSDHMDKMTQIVLDYESAKRREGRIDFTDMLGRFAGVAFDVSGPVDVEPDGEAPDVRVWFHDEMQDASQLAGRVFGRLVNQPRCDLGYCAGDPFQCQPAGTMVRTSEGDVPIEDVEPHQKLIAYQSDDSRFYGTGDTIKFKKASRTVSKADVLKITTESGKTVYGTGNHRWLCRQSENCDPYCVYLMKQSTRWRVGFCQLVTKSPGKSGTFRLKQRWRLEKSDACWILKTFSNDSDARAYENIVSANYGITQVTFEIARSNGFSNLANKDWIDSIFNAIGDNTARAHNCLYDHSLSPSFPYLMKGNSKIKTGVGISSYVHSINLIPGMHKLPIIKEEEWDESYRRKNRGEGETPRRAIQNLVQWEDIILIEPMGSIEDDVTVYSLDVPKYGTYISDGVITGNSLYAWAGGDSSVFMKWPVVREDIQPVSWRCPTEIYRYGDGLLRSCSDYFDRRVIANRSGGNIDRVTISGELPYIDPNESWLLLARTNWLLSKFTGRLKSAGVPFARLRGGGGRWKGPTKEARILAMRAIEHGQPITAEEWRVVVLNTKVKIDGKEILKRGTKTQWHDKMPVDKDTLASIDDLDNWGIGADGKEFIRSGAWRQFDADADDYCRALDQYGYDAVRNPKIRVGTIHSAKGMEADNVMLLSSLTPKVAESRGTQQGHDAEQRLAYVGVTRAKHRVVIADEWRTTARMEL